ncbi:hypothetical protein [Rhodococcoides corynebacterioides]|uniref:Transposase n=1 Tax=Rhodococcoides corynebacterioides TaxID=53972 RepID=A0ABS7P1P6_9NOCA|nr:hypothetical protein [Rhodococcus corynebacterioides]MBY6365136.1 hypothetical protein [Rhodococcus corynebacterioides]MBY6406548.1 hypothetical protein [Rhodococcus corynebacterioides]
MTLDDVADELYGLDPADFVRVRTERQKQARADGDKALAKEIGALRKPTTVGWVLNVLVRDAEDEVGDLFDLGEALREAQQHLSGATLRTLTKQRQRAVRALAARAGEIAADRGHEVGDDVTREVASSLGAALADPAVADDVRAGRLLGAVEYSGFGPLGLVAVPDAPDVPDDDAADEEKGAREDAAGDKAARDEAAEKERKESRRHAEAELNDARAALNDAESTLADATGRRDDARAEVERLRAALAQAEDDAAARDHDVDEATAARDAADARVRNATTRLDRL